LKNAKARPKEFQTKTRSSSIFKQHSLFLENKSISPMEEFPIRPEIKVESEILHNNIIPQKQRLTIDDELVTPIISELEKEIPTTPVVPSLGAELLAHVEVYKEHLDILNSQQKRRRESVRASVSVRLKEFRPTLSPFMNDIKSASTSLRKSGKETETVTPRGSNHTDSAILSILAKRLYIAGDSSDSETESQTSIFSFY
jgi:hypothetical protein